MDIGMSYDGRRRRISPVGEVSSLDPRLHLDELERRDINVEGIVLS